jgi:cytolysin (calcineurin-like family phosphatase)
MRKKILNAQELYDYLTELQRYDIDLRKISLHYRTDFDSDVELITGVCEDLFDAETNNKLESILFYNQLND